MLVPLKNIPFNLVIKSISEQKILPFDTSSKEDKKLLRDLKKVALYSGRSINHKGIVSKRPNEVGNYIEAHVKSALNERGYSADVPKTTNGQKKITGYPDIEFTDKSGKTHYLECKTYSLKNFSTSLRSFYISPSNNSKITENAHHFIISFETYIYKENSRKNIFKVKSWKILTLENLLVDVKYEFNSDNMRLYSTENILAEGKIS
jgi:hypothetical protein